MDFFKVTIEYWIETFSEIGFELRIHFQIQFSIVSQINPAYKKRYNVNSLMFRV